jgi:hypothetical protein
MSLNEICKSVLENADDALACGVVDLNTGKLLGVHHIVPYFTQSYLDAVSAAAVGLFRGTTVKRVEELLTKHRGSPVKDSFEEVFISSKMVFHFMKVIPRKNAVVVLVTKKTALQANGWVAVRDGLAEIQANIP